MSRGSKGLLMMLGTTAALLICDCIWPEIKDSTVVTVICSVPFGIGAIMCLMDARQNCRRNATSMFLGGTMVIGFGYSIAIVNITVPWIAQLAHDTRTFNLLPPWTPFACIPLLALGMTMIRRSGRMIEQEKTRLGDPIDPENLEPGDYTVAYAYISVFGALYVVTMQGGPRLICACRWVRDNSEFLPHELRADKATTVIDYISVERKQGVNGSVTVVTPHRYQLVDPPASEENNPTDANEPESG